MWGLLKQSELADLIDCNSTLTLDHQHQIGIGRVSINNLDLIFCNCL